MRVYILVQRFRRSSQIIDAFANEDKAWDYVEQQMDKYGTDVCKYFTVESMEIIE